MLIQITLQELMLYLVYALGIVAGIIIMPILWNLKKIVGNLRSFLETNHELIKKTIRIMPEVIDNVEQISINVRETSNELKTSIPAILQEVEGVTNSAKGSIELANVVMENMGSGVNETLSSYRKDTLDPMIYLHIFEEVLQIIYRKFSSSK